VANIVDMSGS